MDNDQILNKIIEWLVSWFAKEEVEATISIPLDPPKSAIEPEPAKPVEFKLTRVRYTAQGVFGELTRDGQHVCFTLEHAFEQWQPKLSKGTYTCKRGEHRLHGMTQDFQAFEVLDVPPFQGKSVTGILLHVGNYQTDSDGCILLGMGAFETMISNSRDAFAAFMASLEGIDTFILNVA